MVYIYSKIKQICLPFFRSSSKFASKNAEKSIAPGTSGFNFNSIQFLFKLEQNFNFTVLEKEK